MILPAPPDRLFSRSEVLRRPGWNKGRLALLGEPDRLVINERNWARSVRMWRESWVERVEKQEGT